MGHPEYTGRHDTLLATHTPGVRPLGQSASSGRGPTVTGCRRRKGTRQPRPPHPSLHAAYCRERRAQAQAHEGLPHCGSAWCSPARIRGGSPLAAWQGLCAARPGMWRTHTCQHRWACDAVKRLRLDMRKGAGAHTAHTQGRPSAPRRGEGGTRPSLHTHWAQGIHTIMHNSQQRVHTTEGSYFTRHQSC